jgi:spore coat polysaccharide biosynthesis protein SpsF (cytidylyltransferase family)
MIYEALYREGTCIALEDVLKFLDSRTDIPAINAHYKRNEGYEKSLSQDRIIKGDTE